MDYSMQTQITVSQILNKMRNSLWALLITDALCMPVHWYYNLDILEEDFGYITKYEEPKEVHPTTGKWMTLPKTDDPTLDLIGKVILHDKRQLYQTKGAHYHAGLKAGDVTLGSDIIKVSIDTMLKRKDQTESYDADEFLEAYYTLLTTPGAFKDSYMDSMHQAFVVNKLRGKPLRECLGEENKDTACALAMKLVTPVLYGPLLDYFRAQKVKPEDQVNVPEEVIEKCVSQSLVHLGLIFRGETIKKHTESYSRTMLNVVLGKDLRKAIEEDGDKVYGVNYPDLLSQGKDDLTVALKRFHIACYTDGSLPLGYYLAYKYQDDFDKGIIVNCNLGGENLSRGAIVGSLIAGYKENLKEDSEWITGLVRQKEFKELFENFLKI